MADEETKFVPPEELPDNGAAERREIVASNLEKYIQMQDDPEFRKKVIERVNELMDDPSNDQKGKFRIDQEKIGKKILKMIEDLKLEERPSDSSDKPAKKRFMPNWSYVDNPQIIVGYAGDESSEGRESNHNCLLEILTKKELWNGEARVASPREKSKFGGSFNYRSDFSIGKQQDDSDLRISVEETAEDMNAILSRGDSPIDPEGNKFYFRVMVGNNNGEWKNHKPILEALAKAGFSLALYGQGSNVQCYHIVKKG